MKRGSNNLHHRNTKNYKKRKQIHANNLNNLEEMGQVPETYNIPRLNQEH